MWVSDKGKEIAKINKENRKKKTNNHKTGSTSYSTIREKLIDDGKEATRIEKLIRAFGMENATVRQIVKHYHSEEIQNVLTFMPKDEVEQMCIEKYMPSKKKRNLGLSNAPYIENATSSIRFCWQIRMNEKGKGKGKVTSEDVRKIVEENVELRSRLDV